MKQSLLLTILLIGMSVVHGYPFEVVSYGDAVQWRDNNLAGPAFQSHLASMTETRIILFDRHQATRLRPYLKANLAVSDENIPVENTGTYGIGIEIRPLATDQFLAGEPWLDWLTRMRIFGEYLQQSPLKDEKPAWNPDADLIVGFDLWRPYGAADPNRYGMSDRSWGELFLGTTYHTTDFYLENYDSFRIGANLKAGAKYGSDDLPVMPYVMVDVNTTTDHGFFWQNRLIGGIGIRTERRIGDTSTLRLYIEARTILDYLKDEPAPAENIPDHDVVLGLAYEINRY